MNDLGKHFIAGAAIGAVMVLLGIILFGKYLPDWYAAICFLMPLVAGTLYEAYQYVSGNGTAEVADITLTWTGGMLPVFLWKLIENFI
jgi:hypothetical protein